MKKIYVVLEGTYYQDVVGVFSSFESAKSRYPTYTLSEPSPNPRGNPTWDLIGTGPHESPQIVEMNLEE